MSVRISNFCRTKLIDQSFQVCFCLLHLSLQPCSNFRSQPLDHLRELLIFKLRRGQVTFCLRCFFERLLHMPLQLGDLESLLRQLVDQLVYDGLLFFHLLSELVQLGLHHSVLLG